MGKLKLTDHRFLSGEPRLNNHSKITVIQCKASGQTKGQSYLLKVVNSLPQQSVLGPEPLQDTRTNSEYNCTVAE